MKRAYKGKVRQFAYSGEQGSPTAGSDQTSLILELIRKKFVDFGASARFWTVLRAQKELDGIRTGKMTATLSSFQKTKNHIKILIFHRRISTKTTFFVSETTM